MLESLPTNKLIKYSSDKWLMVCNEFSHSQGAVSFKLYLFIKYAYLSCSVWILFKETYYFLCRFTPKWYRRSLNNCPFLELVNCPMIGQFKLKSYLFKCRNCFVYVLGVNGVKPLGFYLKNEIWKIV